LAARYDHPGRPLYRTSYAPAASSVRRGGSGDRGRLRFSYWPSPFRASPTAGTGVLVGLVVPAQTAIAPTGKVFADGAYWDARSETPVSVGESVEIVGVEGLLLVVKPHPAPDQQKEHV
jgi:hypothetical protein